MQVNFPKKLSPVHWDSLNVNYPVTKIPSSFLSSEEISRKWRGQPEVLQETMKYTSKQPVDEVHNYMCDYRITKDLMQSQSTVDYNFKISDGNRCNKRTSSVEYQYIYPPSRRLENHPLACRSHGTTEMKASFTTPIIPSRLATDKDQFKMPVFFECESSKIEPSHKELEFMDTNYKGYLKFLDPYLTTSRLHYRPYSSEQLSNARDIITYHTLTSEPWIRTTKPKYDLWNLSLSKPTKSIYDREKFKNEFREINTHNKLKWTPGSFRTETRDNYTTFSLQSETQVQNLEQYVATNYHRSVAKLQISTPYENLSIKQTYGRKV